MYVCMYVSKYLSMYNIYVCILHDIQSCADVAVVWLSAYQNVHTHTTEIRKQPKRCHFLCTIVEMYVCMCVLILGWSK